MSFHDPHLLVAAGESVFAISGVRILRIERYEAEGEPQLDLSRMLGGKPVTPGPETTVVVVSVGRDRARGLIVDKAIGIATFDQHQIVPPPDFGEDVDLAYLAGLVKWEDRFAVVLDLDRLLAEVEAAA